MEAPGQLPSLPSPKSGAGPELARRLLERSGRWSKSLLLW